MSLGVDPYEKSWMWAGAALLLLFLLAVAASVFYGFRLPSHASRLDPGRVMSGAPFAKPGVIEREPGRYDAYVRAQIWSFAPNEIRVPAGSTVTFYLASPDVLHGFAIERTNVNVTVLPGQISKVTTRFDKSGEYRFLCHEYCGVGHHAMFGKVVVEPRS